MSENNHPISEVLHITMDKVKEMVDANTVAPHATEVGIAPQAFQKSCCTSEDWVRIVIPFKSSGVLTSFFP